VGAPAAAAIALSTSMRVWRVRALSISPSGVTAGNLLQPFRDRLGHVSNQWIDSILCDETSDIQC